MRPGFDCRRTAAPSTQQRSLAVPRAVSAAHVIISSNLGTFRPARSSPCRRACKRSQFQHRYFAALDPARALKQRIKATFCLTNSLFLQLAVVCSRQHNRSPINSRAAAAAGEPVSPVWFGYAFQQGSKALYNLGCYLVGPLVNFVEPLSRVLLLCALFALLCCNSQAIPAAASAEMAQGMQVSSKQQQQASGMVHPADLPPTMKILLRAYR